MIEIKSLSRSFGDFKAVDNVSFEIPAGEIIGFLGPNGAGKSTTMKMLACYLQPSSGTAVINGKDIRHDSLAVRKLLGYLPESCPLYSEMTVQEFLSFIGEIRGLRGGALKSALNRVAEICALESVWFQAIETLSKGYRQRVGFAQALIHDPPVLILDEPTDGLDPNQKHGVRDLIKEMGKSKTIILSTHILEEVEAVCQRAVIIAEGKIVADASPEELCGRSKLHNSVVVTVADSTTMESAIKCFEGLPNVENVKGLQEVSGAYSIRILPVDRKKIIGNISTAIAKENIAIDGIVAEKGRLDDVFREVTVKQ